MDILHTSDELLWSGHPFLQSFMQALSEVVVKIVHRKLMQDQISQSQLVISHVAHVPCCCCCTHVVWKPSILRGCCSNQHDSSAVGSAHFLAKTVWKASLLMNVSFSPNQVMLNPIFATCRHANLDFILNTHHHWDHVGGNEELKACYGAQIVGPKADEARIPGIDLALAEGETWKLGDLEMRVFDTPGHTRGHITLWFPEAEVMFPGTSCTYCTSNVQGLDGCLNLNCSSSSTAMGQHPQSVCLLLRIYSFVFVLQHHMRLGIILSACGNIHWALTS